MIIIVGLGNPGEQFKTTRHNAGFMAVDFFAQKNDFPDFTLSKKYHAFVSEKEDIILVKPQSFMNESGKSVKAIIKNTKGDLVVIHDDIDLSLGTLKISKDSGSGGHKGVGSIIENLGTKDFIRLKMGICPLGGKPNDVESFVITKFSPQEQETLNQAIPRISEALDSFIKHGLEKTMNEYN